MSMKALRSLALFFCLVPLCLSSGALQAAQPAVQAQSKPGAVVAKPKPVARKPLRKAVAKPLPKPKLDLSLPVEMVKDLKPDVGTSTPGRAPLLPSMFPVKPMSDDSPFQLNGRLISNEMQLQLRNDSRRDVDGAAIDFEFRQ